MRGRGRGAQHQGLAMAILLVAAACSSPLGNRVAFPITTAPAEGGAPVEGGAPAAGRVGATSATTTTAAAWAPPQPYGTAVAGLLTFRGNPTRTYYGEGPVPAAPQVAWQFPERAMCTESVEGGVRTRWCGMGWTGQPAVAERNGRTWLVFGAYDGAVHFLDAATGRRLLPDFITGDIIKGSVTFDPDGYPLVYTGSRDNYFRMIAIDGDRPVELWRLHPDDLAPGLWNDDWDSSALVLDGHLVVGGENGRWVVVRLNRGYDATGRVVASPEVVFDGPGWDDELLDDLGDYNVSIEGSVAVWEDTVYFANSGGLVQGWDMSGLAEGREPIRVFRFWTGDDTDATVVIDDEGMLYVASEWERDTDRARAVGQIMKLDPRRRDPLVWSLPDRPVPTTTTVRIGGGPDDGDGEEVAGVWATPALHRDLVIVPTNGGRLLGLDRGTGAVRWSKQLPGPVWQSPVVVGGVLLQGDCAGYLHAYDLSDPAVDPPELWQVPLGGCIEATPAVWKGRVYVGTRGGFLVALADR